MFFKFLFALIVVAFSWPFIGPIVMLVLGAIISLGQFIMAGFALLGLYLFVIKPIFGNKNADGDNTEEHDG